MEYIFVIILLFAGILIYFKIADRFNIIDRPNERSSHNYITIRGGGVVFWLAAVLSYIFRPRIFCPMGESIEDMILYNSDVYFYFLIGITLISAVSFWDDIKSLPNKIRIVIHFISISCVFYGLDVFALPFWLIVLAYIVFVGILNAYNFMDGINGITGLYSLVILISLQIVNYQFIKFTTPDFINYAIIACIVFLFFNFRKKARCFAGDVGSMAIAFWIVTLLLQLMLKTNSVICLMLLAVYGVDSICTIIYRLYKKENIFKPHRRHVYQLLANELKIPHLVVATVYAVLQALIFVGMLLCTEFLWIYSVIVLFILITLQFIIRNNTLKTEHF